MRRRAFETLETALANLESAGAAMDAKPAIKVSEREFALVEHLAMRAMAASDAFDSGCVLEKTAKPKVELMAS